MLSLFRRNPLHFAKAIVAGLVAAGTAIVAYAPSADDEVALVIGLAGAVVAFLGVVYTKNAPKRKR